MSVTLAPSAWHLWAGAGSYLANEKFSLVRDRLCGPGRPSRRPLALVLHGSGATGPDTLAGTDAFGGTTGLDVSAAVHAAGFDLFAPTLGPTNWAAQAYIDALVDALEWAETEGLNTSRLHVVAYSMGGICTLNGFRRAPNGGGPPPLANIRSWVGIVPGINPQDIYARNALTQAALIDAAYAAQGGWPANETAWNPYNHLADFADLPALLLYNSADDVARQTFVQDYDAACPAASSFSYGSNPTFFGHNAIGLDAQMAADFLVNAEQDAFAA